MRKKKLKILNKLALNKTHKSGCEDMDTKILGHLYALKIDLKKGQK